MYSQDWTPVVLKRHIKPTIENAAKLNANVETKNKVESSQQQYNSRAKKLEADLDINIVENVPTIPLNILTPEQRKELIAKRVEKGLNQTQLAKLVNEQATIINNLENGKVVNVANILQKLNKILATKLKFNK